MLQIEKLQQHIESYITREQSRVVYGVHIPKPSHASIIGRGGVGINELSSKHNVRVLFPGWKDNGAGLDSAMINEAEVQDAPADSLVRIVGSEDDCKAAADELLRKQASTPLRASRTSTPQASVTRTVDVPAQHHRVIADGGRFFRRHVPPRVNIAHGDATLPSQLPKPQGGSTNGVSARIDLDEGESSTNEIIQHWEVYPLPNDAENTTIPWIITGQSEESVAKAEAAVVAAMERVQDWTHVAYVNVGRSNMARVIGKGGSGLENLRVASRGDVEALGRKDADTSALYGISNKRWLTYILHSLNRWPTGRLARCQVRIGAARSTVTCRCTPYAIKSGSRPTGIFH